MGYLLNENNCQKKEMVHYSYKIDITQVVMIYSFEPYVHRSFLPNPGSYVELI